MQIDYSIRPIVDEVFYIEECEEHNVPVLVKGRLIRIDIVVTPSSSDPVTTTDTITLKYIVNSPKNRNAVIENPAIYNSVTPGRADMFKLIDRSAAITELDLRLAALSI